MKDHDFQSGEVKNESEDPLFLGAFGPRSAKP